MIRHMLVAVLATVSMIAVAPPATADILFYKDVPDAIKNPRFSWAASLPSSFESDVGIAAGTWDIASENVTDFAFDATSSNVIEHVVIGSGAIATASGVCTGQSAGCYIRFNTDVDFTVGPGPAPDDNALLRGAAVHEFGHWIGLKDCTSPPHSSASPPSSTADAMDSMCFEESGAVQDNEQVSPAQDDLAAVNRNFFKFQGRRRHIMVNSSFAVCEGGGSSCIPDFWDLKWSGTADYAWSTGSNGRLTLKVTSGHSDQEVVQRLDGFRVDFNNNGKFRVDVKAALVNGSSGGTMDVFIRDTDGTPEFGCTFNLTGTYNQYTCQIIESDMNGWVDYEFGVRVDEDTNVIAFWIKDRKT